LLTYKSFVENIEPRITLGPQSFALVPFLNQYAAIATEKIKLAKDATPSLKSTMQNQFNFQYSRFLQHYGLPLSCISLLGGVAQKNDVESLKITFSHLSGKNHEKRIGSTFVTNGIELLKKLQINVDSVDNSYGSHDQNVCDNILLTRKIV